MRIILKPMGAALLVATLTGLTFLALGMGKGPRPTSTAPGRVYADAEENGWETKSWTWAKGVDYANKEFVHSGNAALRVSFKDYDGVKFHHAKPELGRYDRLAFTIHGGKGGGQDVYVGGVLTGERPLRKISLEKLPPGQWRVVVIPLKDLFPANARPDEIDSWWIGGNRAGTQPAVYLDDIQLLPPGTPAPTGTPLEFTVGS